MEALRTDAEHQQAKDGGALTSSQERNFVKFDAVPYSEGSTQMFTIHNAQPPHVQSRQIVVYIYCVSEAKQVSNFEIDFCDFGNFCKIFGVIW